MAQAQRNKVSSSEQVFVELVEQIERHKAGRRALVVTLSLIETARGRQATQNLVCDEIKRGLSGQKFEMFRFSRGDVAVLTKDVSEGQLMDVAFGLVYRLKGETFFKLFNDGEHDLCRLLDVAEEHDVLLSYAKQGLAGQVEIPGTPLVASEPVIDGIAEVRPNTDQSEGGPLVLDAEDLDDLAKTDAALDGTVLEDGPSGYIEEPIVQIPTKGPAGKVLTWVRADRQSLEDRFLFNADEATAGDYLPRLIEHAEHQALQDLAEEPSQQKDLMLSLRVSTLLSAEFLNFDRARAQAGVWPRGQIVLDRDDLKAADRASFEFARDFVEGRGYVLSLSGVTIPALKKLTLKAQGFDYQLVAWDAVEASLTTKADCEDIRAALSREDAAVTILTGCDGPEAIEFGQRIGVHYFAGAQATRALPWGR